MRAVALTGDVSDHESVRRLVADTAEQLGSLDVFVANAGIAQTKALLEVTPEEYDRVHAVNGRGVFLCYTEAARQMIKQGTGGKIIGACSIAGHKGFPLLGVYCSSKFGVRALTQAPHRNGQNTASLSTPTARASSTLRCGWRSIAIWAPSTKSARASR